ncbi:MAG: 2-oxoacid:ferredoxin oxidoreductase subunit beta [Cyclobacteriaceae bacterium]|nr:2-oxoacid:ferredoxin oxidoreductase subunit beta [Cyclobacteriaceae bacterium]
MSTPNTITNGIATLSPKDFASDQNIRWCPGCGDYSILKQVQSILPDLGVPRENIVFISGIGCSSRYPYYMATYGMHGIHGRATAIASGLKAARPDLDVWIVTGDGDALAIGGNHFIHLLRRNFNVNILLFNNEIYGLTKGQYSPTSPKGKISKTSPYGTVDYPFNPLALALGAESTFVARALDRNPKHLRMVLEAAHNHQGASFVEIYQNCNVFNNDNFSIYTDKETKGDNALYLEEGKPLIFGDNNEKGIILHGFTPRKVELGNGFTEDDLWVHDPTDKIKASILTQFFNHEHHHDDLPRPFGVFYREERFTYEKAMEAQIEEATTKLGKGNLDELLRGPNFWSIN